jgi:hypothetical protein
MQNHDHPISYSLSHSPHAHAIRVFNIFNSFGRSLPKHDLSSDISMQASHALLISIPAKLASVTSFLHG